MSKRGEFRAKSLWTLTGLENGNVSLNVFCAKIVRTSCSFTDWKAPTERDHDFPAFFSERFMHEILFDQYKVEIQYSATKAQTERLTVSSPFSQNKRIFAPDKQNNL